METENKKLVIFLALVAVAVWLRNAAVWSQPK